MNNYINYKKFMTLQEFHEKALRTDYKDYADFHTGDVSPRLDYGTMGLVTESGKVMDIIKKTKKGLGPLKREAITEELSDVLWYLNLTIDELGISWDELMQACLQKIDTKYPADDPEKTKHIRNT
ncbi:nucleoside triphosphate pyrophosphohydrolase family protein [Patescibacteria group bacterium]|nr:nucleoside triphosphate pyrophosphohydrolase family protein [Patescibacteria group bacterium]